MDAQGSAPGLGVSTYSHTHTYLMTEAVRPAAELPFPEVYTPTGATYIIHKQSSSTTSTFLPTSYIFSKARPTQLHTYPTYLFNELEQLTLGCGGIAQQQNIDVST